MPAMVNKRQLGISITAIGLIAGLGLLVAGRVGVGNWGGIGPLERNLLLACLAIAMSGLPLLRLGAAPAAAEQEPRYNVPAAAAKSTVWVWVARVLAGLAVLAFLAYLSVYVAYAADLFRWPYDYDQGESFELYDAVLHSQGEWPYRDADTFPFYSSNYPPVFHLLTIPLFPLLGQKLLAGRVLSFVVTLLTAALLGWIVRKRTGGWFLPLMVGLSYTASNFVYHVGPLCRQQLTMVFMETLAVYFVAGAFDERHGKRNLLLGLLFLLIAGYTKQLAVFTSLAIFGYLFLRAPKRAIVAAFCFGLIFGAVFLWINWATAGQWWLNTISANVNAYLIPQLIGLTRSWFKVHTLFVFAAIGFVIYETYFGKLSIYSLWFVSALGTGLMSGKWGAGEAYWITSVAAACILTGFALGKLYEYVATIRPNWRVYATAMIPLLFLAQSTRMLHLPTAGAFWGPIARALGVEGQSVYADYAYYDSVGYSQVGHFMQPRDYVSGARIMEYLAATDKPVLSEEAAFTMLAGKPVVSNPTQLLNLYNNGLLDTSALEAMIRRQEFGVVVMRAQFYPPPVLAALGQHYGLVEHVQLNGFNYIVMLPLDKADN